MFYEQLQKACEKRNVKLSPTVIECGGKIGSIDGWKKGAEPNSKIVKALALRLNVTTDFLLLGNNEIVNIKLQHYRWDFPENNQTDKLYNRVCRTMYLIHGKIEASARLSALNISSEHTEEIDSNMLLWLAFYSNTNYTFFELDDIDNLNHRQLIERIDIIKTSYPTIDTLEELVKAVPQTSEWNERYLSLYNIALHEQVSKDCSNEIFETLSLFNANEQQQFMGYFRQAVKQFKQDKNAAYEETFADDLAKENA